MVWDWIFRVHFSGILEPILNEFETFFGKEPYEPPKILVIPSLASQYILSDGLHITLCCHPQGWTGH